MSPLLDISRCQKMNSCVLTSDTAMMMSGDERERCTTFVSAENSDRSLLGCSFRANLAPIPGLNSRVSDTYVPYQEFDSLQLLNELMTDPDNFSQHLGRYTTSVASTVIYGVRTTEGSRYTADLKKVKSSLPSNTYPHYHQMIPRQLTGVNTCSG